MRSKAASQLSLVGPNFPNPRPRILTTLGWDIPQQAEDCLDLFEVRNSKNKEQGLERTPTSVSLRRLCIHLHCLLCTVQAT